MVWGSLTEGIKAPYAFGEAFLLSKGTLIESMVCKPVHEELCSSSVHWNTGDPPQNNC